MNKRNFLISIIFIKCTILLSLSSYSLADILILKNGDKFEGRIIKEKESSVVFDVYIESDILRMEFNKNEIEVLNKTGEAPSVGEHKKPKKSIWVRIKEFFKQEDSKERDQEWEKQLEKEKELAKKRRSEQKKKSKASATKRPKCKPYTKCPYR